MSSPTHLTSGLPGYEVLEEIGAGGMGVVFKARQTALKRIVAIKMIRSGIKPGRQELARFRFEAEAVARLQHPNIVQVFAVNELDGEPYLAMEYLDGGSLAKKIDGKPQPWREAAGLIETLAKAVHYAHSRGIIHRDLKPANVLLAADGTPKIADFGLAKPIEGEGVTEGQGILGSPSYMAPEQAWGGSRIRDVGPAVDVYALGAVLYELLTGRPPFKGTSSRQTLEQVWRDRPVSPRLIESTVPRDLEVICLKCLEKEPAKRYADAHELAEDLRRFRKGIPIKARAVGKVERGWSWCKRNPLPAALVAALIVALIAGFTGITIKYFDAEAARRDADHESGKARSAEAIARTAELQATRLAAAASEAERKAKESERLALEGQAALYASLVRSIDGDYRNNDLPMALSKLESLTPPPGGADRRGFEYHWLMRRVRGEVAHWPIEYGEAWDMAVDPKGTAVAFTKLQSTQVIVLDLQTGQTLHTLPGHKDNALCVAWSSDGKLIATGGADGFARLWNAETGALAASFASKQGAVDDIAFSADGKRVVCAHGDTTAAVWSIEDTATPKRITLFTGHTRRYPHRDDRIKSGLWTHTRIAISPDGTLVATAADHFGSSQGERGLRGILGGPSCDVLLWQADDGAEKRAIESIPVTYIHDLAFSGDGTLLAAGGDDGAIYAWSVADGKAQKKRVAHTGPVRRIAFIGDRPRLASVSWDRSLRIWDMTDDAKGPIRNQPAHNKRVSSVAVTADGKHVVTSANEEIKLWLVAAHPGYTKLPTLDHIEEAAFHPADGALLVTASRDGALRVWDATKGQAVFSIRLDGPITAMAFSPDARRLAVAGGRRISVVDLAQRKAVVTYDGQAAGGATRTVRSLVFSPDGTKVLSIRSSLAFGGDAHLWDAATGQAIWAKDLMTPPTKDFFAPQPTRKSLVPSSARFGPDGATIEIAGTVTLSLLNTVLVIDAKNGEVLRQMEGPSRLITAPSGTAHATVERSGENRTIVIRAAGADAKPVELTGIPRLVNAAAFNHDASRLAVACDNEYGSERGDLRVWDAGTGRELLHIQGIEKDIRRVSFSADGHRLAVLCADGSVRIYDGSPAAGANERKN